MLTRTSDVGQAHPAYPADVSKTKEALKKQFPGWNFIHSSTGRWWASGRCESQGTGHHVCVDTDTPEQLAAKLNKIIGKGSGEH